MNHEDNEALGFLVIGVILILLAAVALTTCQPISVRAPAEVPQPRSASI